MEVAVPVGNMPPEVVDTVDTVVGRLEIMGAMTLLLLGGLSIDGEEEHLGCCEG
jgi:hypothetical protein